MRTGRMKMRGKPCYYHIYNRIGGRPDDLPFNDVDKERAFKLLKEICGFYLIEVVSAVWLSNHYHVVLYCPSELPSDEVIAERHNRYFGENGPKMLSTDRARCQRIGERMLDISDMFAIYQQRFTAYFNRATGRRGRLWGDRFKSVILEGKEALWSCVKYVELNGVRAGLADDPADYRFCSWGRFCGSGKHPFGSNFITHLRRSMGERGEKMTDAQVVVAFRRELARTLANEREDSEAQLAEATAATEHGDTVTARFLRRTRHFTQGAILGSRLFVQEIGSHFRGPARMHDKPLGELHDVVADVTVHSLRRPAQLIREFASCSR